MTDSFVVRVENSIHIDEWYVLPHPYAINVSLLDFTPEQNQAFHPFRLSEPFTRNGISSDLIAVELAPGLRFAYLDHKDGISQLGDRNHLVPQAQTYVVTDVFGTPVFSIENANGTLACKVVLPRDAHELRNAHELARKARLAVNEYERAVGTLFSLPFVQFERSFVITDPAKIGVNLFGFDDLPIVAGYPKDLYDYAVESGLLDRIFGEELARELLSNDDANRRFVIDRLIGAVQGTAEIFDIEFEQFADNLSVSPKPTGDGSLVNISLPSDLAEERGKEVRTDTVIHKLSAGLSQMPEVARAAIDFAQNVVAIPEGEIPLAHPFVH